MSIARTIEPEWLDSLPASDPGALGSRRDLRRLNWLMLHDRIVARALAIHSAPIPLRIIEIGAGDGEFMLSVARRLAAHRPDVTITLVDRQDIVSGKVRLDFGALGWRVETVTADIFDFLDQITPGAFDAIVANLFLHHFGERELRFLLGRSARLARLFVACEPSRDFVSVQASRLVWAIGCNRVTCHDAPASARAGFRDGELSALWPKGQAWQLQEGRTGFFSHRFVARHADL